MDEEKKVTEPEEENLGRKELFTFDPDEIPYHDLPLQKVWVEGYITAVKNVLTALKKVTEEDNGPLEESSADNSGESEDL